MGTPHNEAAPGAFAKTVLMPGDPLRANFIAESFLKDVKLVNNVRGIQGYTGTYKGTPVSVMASGMGIPSIGIYSYELFHFYDVDNIIRVGSAGGISPKLKLRDVVMAQGACTDSNYASQYALPGTFAPLRTSDCWRPPWLWPGGWVWSRLWATSSPLTRSITRRAGRWTGAPWACWPSRWRLLPCTATPPRRASGL